MTTTRATRPRTPAAPSDDPPWREQELLLLSEVTRLVGRSLAPAIVMQEMLHLLSELLGLNRGRIVLRDDVSGTTMARHSPATRSSIRYAYGLTRSERDRGSYGPGEGITGTVIATGHAVIVQDIDADPRFLARAVKRDALPQETVAFIALPIEVNRRTVGMLGVHRLRSRSRLLDDDIAILKILATLAGQLLQLSALAEEKTKALEAHNAMLARALESSSARYGIIGTSAALLRALGELERVSQASASVLLSGASGTGKELFARALHLASQRRDSPFIKVNCAAIPEALFESELFGHERGAFTGAVAPRAGWFEQADTGTIFLDEIGELPLAMQAKLLRTLQESTIVRLGGKQEKKIDIRLVAATNRDLTRDVERGAFRSDLFYRLNVIPIRLPTLSERREDIRPLALHFLSRVNQANHRNVHFSSAALSLLERHTWPGNIRELANVVERAVLLTEHLIVSADEVERFLSKHVATPLTRDPPQQWNTAPPLVRDYRELRSHSAAELLDMLARHGGNQSRAAQALGLTPRQFGYRLRKLER